jgi:hypothetical protein
VWIKIADPKPHIDLILTPIPLLAEDFHHMFYRKNGTQFSSSGTHLVLVPDGISLKASYYLQHADSSLSQF